MTGWEQVAGSGENDPLRLATSGETQRWSFHGHIFDFGCRLVPHRYPGIPNGVSLEMRLTESAAGDVRDPVDVALLANATGQGAEVASDFDDLALIGIREQVVRLFSYAGKEVLAREELQRLSGVGAADDVDDQAGATQGS